MIYRHTFNHDRHYLFALICIALLLFFPDITEAPLKSIRSTLIAVVTAYTAQRSETDDTPEIMASGKRIYTNAIACPRRYPFGTKVIIDNKEYTCEDRLAQKYDDRFDILMENVPEALEWGKQNKLVEIRY